MSNNLLGNGGFEDDHYTTDRCMVWTDTTHMHEEPHDNIRAPDGWFVWYMHQPLNDLSLALHQPEVKRMRYIDYPYRVHSGQRSVLFFTTQRRHYGGLYQRVTGIAPGTRLNLTAHVHCWSNWHDGPHPHDGRWSEGAGYNGLFVGAWRPDIPAGADNITVRIGIDPHGGVSPFSEDVVWGPGFHVLNEYAQLPAVEAVAGEDGEVTVFLESVAKWPYAHNDVYWDDISLVAVGRGLPREQYERTYVLLSPGTSREMAEAVVRASWDDHRYTVGGSADDAGIGDLDFRRVIAINPDGWPGDLVAFFETYYPGVDLVTVKAQTPEEVAAALRAL